MTTKPEEIVLADGWLERDCQRAVAAVARWPKWKQDWYQVPSADPCHRRRACDEAQTCVGGCVYGNRH